MLCGGVGGPGGGCAGVFFFCGAMFGNVSVYIVCLHMKY